MKRTTRRSAAAARRLIAHTADTSHDALRDDVAQALSTYHPQRIGPDTWCRVEPVVGQVLNASEVRGLESLRKHVTHLAIFFGWAHDQELDVKSSTLTRLNIDAFISSGMTDASAKSRADRRARLRRIADHLHPDAAPRGAVIARPDAKPPYTSAEMASICRTALAQNGPTGRRLCLCVGLGAGAGVASADLRALRRRDIDDCGDDGVYVTLRAPRPRTVPVLRDYEHLVRAGLQGLTADDLVLGLPPDARNLAARAVEEAVVLNDCPHIQQSRLRHTWLAVMLSARVPLRTLLTAAGLKSTRTLTDLLEHLPPEPPTALEDLRAPEVSR